MDFNNSPDFGDLPLPDPNAQTTPDFPPPPNFDVPAGTAVTPAGDPVSATDSAVQGGGSGTMDKKQFIYTLIIALFITLVIGAIILFGVSAYMKANEPPPTTTKYQFGNGSAPQPTKPAPTKVVKAPAEASPSAALSPTGAASTWRIRMKQVNTKLSTLTDPKTATLTATLFGPIEKDSYVCTAATTSDNQYFTFKKSEKVFERLCDATMEKPAENLTCTKYDSDLGIPISQTIYPKTDCSEGTIDTGTYVLYSKVFYNCDLAGKSLSSISSDACKENIEVYSDEMTVEE